MPEKADRVLQEALDHDNITGTQYRQLKEIIKHIENGKSIS